MATQPTQTPSTNPRKSRATSRTPLRRKPPASKPKCGIIMPISAIDNCTDQHWSDVRDIIEAAIEQAGFETRLVSDADEVGIIQKRIIQNVYDDPIVVCDVSGKNPNVMFELGMRLAFDKPAVIVKDDKTAYSFDTSPVERLEYPRDLRFASIVDFQSSLTTKVEATYKASTADPKYSTFLKTFGTFSVAKVDTRPSTKEDDILDELRSLKTLLLRRPDLRVTDDPEAAHVPHTVIRQLDVAIYNALRSPQVRKQKNPDRLLAISQYLLRHEPGIMAHFSPATFNRLLRQRIEAFGDPLFPVPHR